MKGKPGNPKGNPNLRNLTNNIGRPSIRGKSGRKTAGEEYRRYMDELALMYEPSDIEIIKEKIRQKKPVSIREIMLLKEAGGNDRLIATHYGKVVPDKIEHSGPEGKPIPILQILSEKKIR